MKKLMIIIAVALLSFSTVTTAHLKGCYPDICDTPDSSTPVISNEYCNPYPECVLWPDDTQEQ